MALCLDMELCNKLYTYSYLLQYAHKSRHLLRRTLVLCLATVVTFQMSVGFVWSNFVHKFVYSDPLWPIHLVA